MKLLYCEDCGDIVAPHNRALRVRRCECSRHAVWWTEPQRGILRVCDCSGSKGFSQVKGGPPFGNPRAFVIGLTNALLHFPGDATPCAFEVQRLIDAHPASYIFKQTRSLVIRIRPGDSSDTAWAPLPEGA